jgi:hypothetical protein
MKKQRYRDRPGRDGEHGAERHHRRHLREDLQRADVEAEARAAEPEAAREGAELLQIEAEARERGRDWRRNRRG